ncbi:hypothetical protein PU629_08855 [Pullulanibacillus sp. KACC 23026]|uniref:hypothetical protein n=1 Tax=Pullulanibacillus sp. KACC 23026 TaxID=3028315 RepID=UPI0023B1496F|nr:hypothetical protein [Pullulanibacillus sp. KACC 23026]WEG14446.1 hypothetical protein PU629_08855 [Pullulanibacillus sp. KACC 23026]
MVPLIVTVILLVATVLSITALIKKRKKAGATGITTALTPICMYLIALTNLLAYWLDFIGVLSWAITIILLISGAYFTKYRPQPDK